MATFTSNTSNGYYLKVVTSVGTQSVPNNTTAVGYSVYLHQSSTRFSNSSNSGNVKINGTTVYTVPASFNSTNWNRDTDILLASGTLTIPHNSDGTKTISITGTWTSAGGTYAPGTLSLSGSQTLPTINRIATLTGADNFNDEGNPTVTYSNPLGNAVTSLEACIANTGGSVIYAAYRAVSKTGSSYTFSLTTAERNALRAAMPSATSMTVRFYLRTVIGGSTYHSTVDKTVSITNAEPTITGSYADQNADIVAVTVNNQLLISGLSNAKVTAIPVLKKYATVSSVKIGDVNVTAGGSPYTRTINAVTAASYSIEVTDSRGYTATGTVTLDYITYNAITFLASFFRTAAMNNEIALQYSGTFHNATIGNTTNTLTVRYRYQPELGEWSEWITTPPTTDENNFSNPGTQVLLTGSFDHNKQYMFEIEFKDALDTKTSTLLVRAGRHILKVTENVQVLQGKLHIQKLYTKEDKDFVFDFVYDVITRVWVVHVYGLTQLFEPQHIFQSDVNTRSIITVLNTEGYPLLKYTINDVADNFIDYVNVDEPAHYNNYTLLDTGISPLDGVLDKRAREFQFTTFSKSAEAMEFFVSTYIDSRNVSNTEETTIDWVSDPEDPNYGQLYEIEEEIANVYGETNLDSWVIDYSNFPKIGLVKSHLRLHGKGLFYRAIIINRDMIEHELSGVAWVYRIMNAR